MAYDPTNAAQARSYLEDALALTLKPTLTPEQVDRALGLAETLDEDGNVVYPAAALNRAAAWGWGIKAGLTSDQYDLGAGQGRTLDRSQWHAHCKQMQRDYAHGNLSVVGDVRTGRGIGSIGLVTSLGADEVW